MSGILGIYHRDQRLIDPSQLEAMMQTLAHRGGDAANTWQQDFIGLGHQMRWSTPEALAETLPFINQRQDLVITADARIDNREELLMAFGLTQLSQEQLISDSELILAAYDRWGEDCPQHLLGDFAFAIWDVRRQQLFCARDHFGVRAFYYHKTANCFAFASEIKALLCLDHIPCRVNPLRVSDYVAVYFEDVESTFYHDIFRLAPAHSLVVTPHEFRCQRYWQLDPQREIQLESDQAYADAFYEVFSEAVRCRLRSCSPVGVFLSGGLDSSSIAATARKLVAQADQPQPQIHTFSAVFDRLAECDERPYIHALTQQGGFQAHEIVGDDRSPLQPIEQMLWHQDEPFYGRNWAMGWKLYEAVQAQGIRVTLDGFDGDIVVSYGYGYLVELAQAGRWLKLHQELRCLAGRLSQQDTFDVNQIWWGYVHQFKLRSLCARYRGVRLGFKLWAKFTRVLRTPANRRRKPIAEPVFEPDWQRLLNPKLVAHYDLPDRYQGPPGKSENQKTERERHYHDMTQGLVSFALGVSHRTTAAFGVEERYPFFDKRVVEFCVALPAAQKRQLGWDRVVMRRAMQGILPAKIQWRKDKGNFTPNFIDGLVNLERDRLADLLPDAIAAAEPYIDRQEFQRLTEWVRSPKAIPADHEVGQLWVPLSLGLWLRSVHPSRHRPFQPQQNMTQSVSTPRGATVPISALN
jgi:asparagine synthase (glutamine-hydrolysing)